ncbi:unnamed protein product [Caenorhabditis angaria]|uniref:Uncharacterized protein n=1 Tax=Caenorhabditis angaria TaxID=860376 RepID=A0A9P1N1B5_9PELO|nr:unnamed protein product [Caenorhabditis angaria]
MNLEIFLLIFFLDAALGQFFPDPVTFENSQIHRKSSESQYKYREEYVKVPIDHFTYRNDLEFNLRYLINTDSFKKGGPILFYPGNEGKIEKFADNTGFMFDLAPELNAAVVFVEHRYYGKSKPFGNESYSNIENLGYFSSAQALADFAFVVQHLKNGKTIPGADKNTAVIAFGGSYGGLLAAWLRIKYPHIVDGALASSAPSLDFNLKPTDFTKVTTRTFVDAGCNRKAIEKGWNVMDKLAKTKAGRAKLNKIFKLDPKKSLILKKEDVDFLKGYVKGAFIIMAFVDYPYETQFLEKVPGWPVKKACEKVRKVEKSDEKTMEQMYEIANLYFNYTGDKMFHCANHEKCDGGFSSLGDPLGWSWQSCTEEIGQMCPDGPPNDFFWKTCPDTLEKQLEGCLSTFSHLGYKKSMFHPNIVSHNYGLSTMPTATNIIFSNGYLDPWSAHGYSKKNVLKGPIKSIILKTGAHHYDLRGAHKLDTKEQFFRDPVTFENSQIHRKTSESPYKYREEYVKVPVDHFTYRNDLEFNLRYLINTDSFKKGGPILLYTGNEGKIEKFADNTGFMFDLAPELNAAVVFVEHRYYGKSKPFGNESYSNIENLGYFSSAQALADFAFVVQHLKNGKTIPGADKNTAVIAFGGSYGGKLAVWLRIKYPHIVDGVIASSSPSPDFGDSKPTDFYKITSRTFIDSGCDRKAIEKGWRVMDKLAKTETGRAKLNKIFKLDPKKSLILKEEDVDFLKGYVKEAIIIMAFVDYPYETQFLGKVPGWSVKKACEKVRKVEKSDDKTVEQLYEIANLYFNYTGDKHFHCVNRNNCDGGFSSLGDPLGWLFQVCTEVIRELCSDGPPNDIFWKTCPDTFERKREACYSTFSHLGYKKSMFHPNIVTHNYGLSTMPTATNIIFTNGYLDPWSGYGYSKKNVLKGPIKSIILKTGAHHYDLRGAHELDTKEVKQVRIFEKNEIKKWIKEKKIKKN